jgi:hypothetical protein
MARVVLLLAVCSYSVAENTGSSIEWPNVIEKGGAAVIKNMKDSKDGSNVLQGIADTISGIGDLTSIICPGPAGALIGAGLGVAGGILSLFVPSKPQTSLDDVLNAVTSGFKQTDAILATISTSLDNIMQSMADYFLELETQLDTIRVMVDNVLFEDTFGKELTQIKGRFASIQSGLMSAAKQSWSGALTEPHGPIALLNEKFDDFQDNLQRVGTWGSTAVIRYISSAIQTSGTGAALYAYERIMTGRVHMFVMMQMQMQFNVTSVTLKEQYDSLVNRAKELADNFKAEQNIIQDFLKSRSLFGYLGQQEVNKFLLGNQIELHTGTGFELNGRYMLPETKTSLEAALSATPPAGFKPSKRVLVVTLSGAERQFVLMTGKQQWNPSETVPVTHSWYGDMITASGMLQWPENSGVYLLNGVVSSLQYCNSSGMHPVPSAATSIYFDVRHLKYSFDLRMCWNSAYVSSQGQKTKCWPPCASNELCLWFIGIRGDDGMMMFQRNQAFVWNSITKSIQLSNSLPLINHNGQKHYHKNVENVCDMTTDASVIDDKVFYLTLHTAKAVQPISASPSMTVYV